MSISEELQARGQQHLLRFWNELNGVEQARFEEQLKRIDWSLLDEIEKPEHTALGDIQPIDGMTIAEINAKRGELEKAGKEAVRAGKVAAVLLAGGMGTRLGSSSPKGCYNIGLTRPLYIFEQLIRNLQDSTKACGADIPLLIMTSEKNDAETRAFFKEHDYFGYPASLVRFFPQQMAVCVGFDKKVLLEGKGTVALSPNGNGGWYASLVRAGLLEDEILKRVEWFNVFAVDNVLQRIADPAFVGAAILSGKKCAAKVVRKARPDEKVGVLCLRNGLPDVIEYYEISEELASLKDGEGNLLYS
nr:UTP--glucose-1-phosphate uridylyltransferase [Clostridia bacterium]